MLGLGLSADRAYGARRCDRTRTHTVLVACMMYAIRHTSRAHMEYTIMVRTARVKRTQVENTNVESTSTNTSTPDKDRKEPIKIANLKQVSEILGLGEARVRYLVSNGILAYESVDMPEFNISLNVVKPHHIEEYKARVESGETGSRKHDGMTAYSLWIPDDKIDAVLALLQEHGCDVKIKPTRKASTDNADAATTASPANVEAEQARHEAVLESIS